MPNEMDLDITLPGSEEESSEDADETQDGEETGEESSEEDGDESSEEDEESKESDEDEEEKDDEEKEDKEDDEDEDEDDKKKDKQFRHSRPSFRDIKEAYPDFFKKFPDLRDAFFREREYSKVFPTVDDAKEALQYAQSFAQISQTLMEGDPSTLLSQIQEANPQAFAQIATNFLPVVHKLDKETFFSITTPLLERFVMSMDKEADKTGNANLKKAALIVGHFMTGEYKIPDSSTSRREDPERAKLAEEKTKFNQEREATAQQDVFNAGGAAITELIEKSLEEDKELSDWQRQKLTEEILKKVNKTLTQDERHMALMNSLWRKWAKSGYSAEAKKAIVNAYLSRAKQVIIPTRDKVMKDAMKRKPLKKVNKPQETSENGERRQSKEGLDPKKIDWSRTSDKDFLEGKVTMRK